MRILILGRGEAKSIFKITKAKRAGGMAQTIDHQPSKCKALSSNPSTAKNKIKQKS
jgi:hypothetical protein